MIRFPAILLCVSVLAADAGPLDPAKPPTADPVRLAADGFLPLFNERSLAGWTKVGGTGEFKVEDQTIVGWGRNIRGNTFLRTKKTYSDFVLVFEFRFVDLSGNSGCQFRSRQRDGNGRVYGYQCELDNNSRRVFTAGVYDEARRGWLHPPKHGPRTEAKAFSEEGRNIFRWDGWNTVVVRCEGRHIRTWLNGKPRADFKDTDEKHFTPEGFIALQVHGGKSCHVQWRHIYLRDLSPNK